MYLHSYIIVYTFFINLYSTTNHKYVCHEKSTAKCAAKWKRLEIPALDESYIVDNIATLTVVVSFPFTTWQ
jgi:hypothetical protein